MSQQKDEYINANGKWARFLILEIRYQQTRPIDLPDNEYNRAFFIDLFVALALQDSVTHIPMPLNRRKDLN